MGTVFADTNRAAARTMAHNGAAVDLPAGQQCCGALHVHAGIFEPARRLARRNIDAFGDGDEPIVVTAAGCGPESGGGGAPPPPAKPIRTRVTYQEPCPLAPAQRITAEPRTLLKAI